MIMSSNKTHDIACYFHISQDFKRYIAQQEGLPFKYGKSKKSLSVDHFASILRRAFLVSTCFANDSEKAINNCSKKQKLKLAKKKKKLWQKPNLWLYSEKEDFTCIKYCAKNYMESSKTITAKSRCQRRSQR